MSMSVILICVALGLFGLTLGSFVNAFVWRLHEGKLRSIVTGRSVCTHCGHVLAVRDLIPVASYVMLRGRCRYCHKPIDDWPLAELLTPALFIVSYLFWPGILYGVTGGILFVIWLIACTGFVALTVYDLKWYELPHKIVLPLIGLVLATTLAMWLIYDWDADIVVRTLLGGVVGGGIFWLIYVLSPRAEEDEGNGKKKRGTRAAKKQPADWKKQGRTALAEARGLVLGEKYSKWIGFGDVTLGLLLGLLLADPGLALLMIFLASLFGTLVAVPLILVKHKTVGHRLPFGPYLMLGAVVAKLWGTVLIGWYLSLLLGPAI